VVSSSQLISWSKLSFKDIVKEVCKLFIGQELKEEEISSAVDEGLSKFSREEVIGLKVIKDFMSLDEKNNINSFLKVLDDKLMVGETFHGPTMTFKDLALTVVGRVMGQFLKKRNKRVIALVGIYALYLDINCKQGSSMNKRNNILSV